MNRWPSRWFVVIALVFGLAVVSPVSAQEPPDYAAFERFADVVESELQDNRAQDGRFEDLRQELVQWRALFQNSDDINAVQIEALTAQLEAIGQAPAEGETEPADIAQRREELQAELATAREPLIRAEESFARSDALVGRIDTTLRARQTDALVQHQSSPLNPVLWPTALSSFTGTLNQAQEELSDNIATRIERGTLWDRLPLVLLLLVAAILLIVRGPRWVEHFIARVEARSGDLGRIVYGFLLSLGAIAAPVIGISLINAALISTGFLGQTGRAVAFGLNLAIFAYAAGRWLGRRLFPVSEHMPSLLLSDEKSRSTGRFLAKMAGLMVGLLLLIHRVDDTVGFESDVVGVLTLPVFAVLGFVLFRLGRLLVRSGQAHAEDETARFPAYVLRLLGRAVQAVGIIGPVLAAVGYFRMAEALLAPTALTLGVLALLTTLHVVVRASYGLFRGLSPEDAAQALFPILISFALGLTALPALALIWGARTTDIGEIWTRFRSGIQLGETTISPGAMITFAIVFGLGFLLTRLIQGTLRSSVLPRTRIDKGGQNAIVSGLGYLGMTLAAVIGITSAGIDLSNLAIIIGALGVGIGFGLQNIVNNFVSGIILLIERPISEGDWVEVNGQMGTVKSISVRSTVIETFDRTDVFVPNGDLISGTVTNWTRGNSIGRVIVPVGVAYGTDTRQIEKILFEIAQDHPIVAVTPSPTILFRGFGADSLDFEIRAILTDVNFVMSVHSDINHEIARRFAEEGIEIPFAQRDIWLRNPDALKSAPPATMGPRPPSGPVDPTLSAPEGSDAE